MISVRKSHLLSKTDPTLSCGCTKKTFTSIFDMIPELCKYWDYKKWRENTRECRYRIKVQCIFGFKECEAKIESIKKQGLTRDSVYESLQLFDKHFNTMTNLEKKSFVRTFIDSIELYPDKKGVNGCPIKTVHFKFPVAYNGEGVYVFPHLYQRLMRSNYAKT